MSLSSDNVQEKYGRCRFAWWVIELLPHPWKVKKSVFIDSWHFFDISIVKGWILYKRDAGNNPLTSKMFKVSVAMSLIKEVESARTNRDWPSTSVERAFIAKIKRGKTAPIPNTSIRTDCYDHLPSFTEKKGDVESLIARDSHLLNVRNVTCDYAWQKHPIVFKNFTSYEWMVLPIRTSVIYTVLFRSYVESILFSDFMMSIFLRWHNNPLKPGNSYDGSLFIDLFMLCYVIFYC